MCPEVAELEEYDSYVDDSYANDFPQKKCVYKIICLHSSLVRHSHDEG